MSVKSSSKSIYLIQLLLEGFLHSLASDISLRGGSRKGTWENDYDHVGRRNAFVEVPPRMKLTRPADNLFLQLVVIHVSSRFDEQGRGRTARSNNYTL